MNKKTAIIPALKGIFEELDEVEDSCEPPETVGDCMYTDAGNYIGIIPKKEWIDTTIRTLFYVRKGKLPDIDYISKEKTTTTFAMEDMKKVLKLFEKYNEVDITLSKDVPLKLECRDFVVYIAPRIEV